MTKKQRLFFDLLEKRGWKRYTGDIWPREQKPVYVKGERAIRPVLSGEVIEHSLIPSLNGPRPSLGRHKDISDVLPDFTISDL